MSENLLFPDADDDFGDDWLKRVRRTDPDTSKDAAKSLTPASITKTQTIVLEALKAHGPMIDYTLIKTLQGESKYHSESGIRTRRCELTEKGLVRDTGRRVTYITNRQCIVWEAI